MHRVNQQLPMIYSEEEDFLEEMMKFYFKERWLENICETLKVRYSEMGQINLSLAEIGIEQDVKDLTMYEARLLGREKS